MMGEWGGTNHWAKDWRSDWVEETVVDIIGFKAQSSGRY